MLARHMSVLLDRSEMVYDMGHGRAQLIDVVIIRPCLACVIWRYVTLMSEW